MSGRGNKRGKVSWDAQVVRALRRHMNMTQQQLAEELGTRQQTISEWETGLYQPRGTSRTLLSIIAERAAFYHPTGGEDTRQPEDDKGTEEKDQE